MGQSKVKISLFIASLFVGVVMHSNELQAKLHFLDQQVIQQLENDFAKSRIPTLEELSFTTWNCTLFGFR